MNYKIKFNNTDEMHDFREKYLTKSAVFISFSNREKTITIKETDY